LGSDEILEMLIKQLNVSGEILSSLEKEGTPNSPRH
jgi:hypothetical protein